MSVLGLGVVMDDVTTENLMTLTLNVFFLVQVIFDQVCHTKH